MSENSTFFLRSSVMFMLEKMTSNLPASRAGMMPSQSWFWNVQVTFIFSHSALP